MSVGRRTLFAAAGAALIAGCASAGPKAELVVTREDGSVVSLDSTTSTFMVGGVRVIHRANFATDVVAASVYLLGGARQLTPTTQGIEALLMSASEYGSAGYPGAALRAAWGATGSALAIDADADWTRFGFRGIRSEFDSSWNVFADRLMRPTLAASDVARSRARLITRVRLRVADPDGLVFLLADSVAYASHPYALRPNGTEASLVVLDSAALVRYHDAQMVQSRMLVVVVGGIDRATVEAAVARTLARLPRGGYTWTLPNAPPARADDAAVTFVERPVSTNYVLGVFHGPLASSPDAPAFRLATALLSSRMNQAVREQRGLSYAAYAPYLDRGLTAGGIYMTTTAPAAALGVVRAQLDTLRRQAYPSAAIAYFARQFVTGYLGNNLTSDDQVDFLARAQLYRGDYRTASHDLDALRSVTPSGVRMAAAKYLTHARFVYIGDTTGVPRSAFARW